MLPPCAAEPISAPMSDTPPPSVSPLAAGLACRCPRCGKGALFKGAFSLEIVERCAECGLGLKFVDPGDGPAVFAIMLLGGVILGGALWVEFRFNPPLWAHVALWLPVTLIVAFGLLRPLKGVLVALQYHHKAEQDRLDDRRPSE
jgi:uncharacterized protein (DUF983 family)